MKSEQLGLFAQGRRIQMNESIELMALGIPDPVSGPRRLHATRHTFVSQCLRLEAPERALQPVTHSTKSLQSERSSSFSLYAHLDWAATCKAVARLERALAVR